MSNEKDKIIRKRKKMIQDLHHISIFCPILGVLMYLEEEFNEIELTIFLFMTIIFPLLFIKHLENKIELMKNE